MFETAQLWGSITITSWLITKPVSSHFSWTNGITLNSKAGTLLSIFELCRSWQFYLTCLEGSSLLELFVPAHTSKHALEHELQCHKSAQLCSHSVRACSERFLQTSCLTGPGSHQGRKARKWGENKWGGMLCSQTPKEAEATQTGNAPFSSQPDEANQVCINLRENSLTKILLHNRSEHFAAVGNKTMSGGSTCNFFWANASSLLPLNVKLHYCFGVFSCI